MFQSATPPIPDEEARLRTLEALKLMETAPDVEFDSLVELAARMLDLPTVMLSLIDRDRQWIKAGTGLRFRETPRDIAFCNATIAQTGLLEIPDALHDRRFRDNPLVTGTPGIRYYGGVPIFARDEDGVQHAIGAFCGIDTRPRTFDDAQRAALGHFARLAEALIAARSAATAAIGLADRLHAQNRVIWQRKTTLNQAERMAGIGSWRYEIASGALSWSDGVFRIHDLEPGDPPAVEQALDFYPPHERARIAALLEAAVNDGKGYRFESDFDTAKGRRRRVRALGEVEMDGDRPVAVVGVFQDITRTYALEQRLRRAARIDEVTQIGNRVGFNRALDSALARTDADSADGADTWLLLIDIDGVRRAADLHGRALADHVLRVVARRLVQPHLADSYAARIDAETFAVVVTDPMLCAGIEGVIDHILDDLARPVETGDGPIAVQGTIGFARANADHPTSRTLIQAAQAALDEAKRSDRGAARGRR
ncbi:MAG: diguanylate cyclase [Sphingomonas sp.]|nr:diguanylate cyclase [Sphingomonas sp.]